MRISKMVGFNFNTTSLPAGKNNRSIDISIHRHIYYRVLYVTRMTLARVAMWAYELPQFFSGKPCWEKCVKEKGSGKIPAIVVRNNNNNKHWS